MLSFSDISKIQSGETLYQDVAFQIKPGEKVGLVGPNGAGKTTLFRLIVGEDRPDSGKISHPQGYKISYFSQNVGEMHGQTALTEVISGNFQVANLKVRMDQLQEDLEKMYQDPSGEINSTKLENILEKLGDVQTEFEKLGGFMLESKAQEILSGLGINANLQNQKVENFSGGWKMRIALAKVLITEPDLILMDEPTNYLDLETIEWLEKWLKQFKGSIFMTSHDRDFMNSIANKIVEVSNKVVTTFSGNYEFYVKEKNIRKDQLEAQKDRQEAMLKKEEEFIAKFAARASHAAQVQSRVKKLDKIDRIVVPPEDMEINFEFPNAPRGGNDVITIDSLSRSFKLPNGEEKVVFSGLNSVVRRLEKIAITGVNGAGKSTLLKIMAGQLEPTLGKCDRGAGIVFGYFSQYALEVLNPENTLWDEIKNKVPLMSDGAVRNLLAAFLFRGDDIDKKVKYLSGGEKSRLVLAGILSTPKNLLILDEPTNHLDIKSREVLLKALQNYEGTILIVSHDRYFLKELANKVWFVEKGQINQYPGTYKEWLNSK